MSTTNKIKPLNVYAVTLSIPFGDGLAIVVSKSKQQAVDMANEKIPYGGGTWQNAEKLPLQTRRKSPKIITSCAHAE